MVDFKKLEDEGWRHGIVTSMEDLRLQLEDNVSFPIHVMVQELVLADGDGIAPTQVMIATIDDKVRVFRAQTMDEAQGAGLRVLRAVRAGVPAKSQTLVDEVLTNKLGWSAIEILREHGLASLVSLE